MSVSFLSLYTTLNSATVLFLNVKTLNLERVLARLIQVSLRAVPSPSNKQRRLTVSDQNYAKNAEGRRIKQELERLYFLYLSPSSLWKAVGFLFWAVLPTYLNSRIFA